MNLDNFGGLAGIGVLAAGLGIAYAQWRSGGNKAKDDLISTLKETAEVERAKAMRLAEEKVTLIKSHQEQINAMNKEIGRLQGLVEANATKVQEYTEIFKGRNPDQTKFMEYMTKVAGDATGYMSDTAHILTEIKTFMSLMNGEIAKGNLFNKEIAEATADGTGKVLRKKV